MNRNESRALREERKGIATQMAILATDGLKTIEDRTKFDAMDTAQKELQARIERIEAVAGLNEEMRGSAPPPAGQPGGGADSPDVAKERRERHKSAFDAYVRQGLGSVSPEQRAAINEFRDMGTSGQGAYPGITSGAGIFVPVGYRDEIEMALKYYGPMLNGGMGDPAILPTTTGQILEWPTDNDTTVSGEMIGENQQVNTADVNIGMIQFGAYKFSSKMVKVSVELLQDSNFDFPTYLGGKFSERIGRALNTKLTIGAGTTEPTGIVTAATSAGTAVGANSNDGTSAANTIGSDDLTTLEHSVDPLYRRGAKYMMNDSTLAAIKKVKDKYGRPLWLPSVSVNAPDTINGYQYLINNDLDQLQTTTGPVTRKTILFGNLTKYMIRRVRDISILRLEERFADFGQVAFIAFARYDGNLLDAGTHPVKYLANVY